jgi:hypothetical protein
MSRSHILDIQTQSPHVGNQKHKTFINKKGRKKIQNFVLLGPSKTVLSIVTL